MNMWFVFVFEYVSNVTSCSFAYRSLYFIEITKNDNYVYFDKFYMFFIRILKVLDPSVTYARV